MGLKDAWRWLTDAPQPTRSGEVERSFTWPFPPNAEPGYFGFSSSSGNPSEEKARFGFTDLVDRGWRSNPIVFAAERVRLSVFSEARFLYRAFAKGRPGRLWSDQSLDILERPWPRGTTSDLLAEIGVMADMGGNGFITRLATEDRLRVLRPDYVTIVMGDSLGRPVQSAAQLDAEVIGFIYDPQDGQTEPEALLPNEVAHFIPPGHRDPLARYRGMSWLTPAVREILGDQAATEHKLAFFTNGATPQLVVSMDASVTEEQFGAFVARMDDAHKGWRNAYKTLYLGGGADVTVVGKDLSQLDFSNTQGKGETRIAAAAGIHPVLIPVSEGMQGSSLNAGNYSAARRSTADITFRPLWRNVAGSLAAIVPPPSGSELWYDEMSIPFLREDSKDAADIMATQSSTVANLVKEGFTAPSAIAAVSALDVTLLEHSGYVSVQLQPPGLPELAAPEPSSSNGNTPALEGAIA